MSFSIRIPSPTSWDTWKYSLGCPVWNCKHWEGQIYPDKSYSRDSLQWYSHSFNTVEGNSTFYAIPDRETVKRWCDQSPSCFRFAMKFPREISHETKLQNCQSSLTRFVELLQVLQDRDRLGPSFLQLGPDFSSLYWDRLRAFLERFPKSIPIAVEFRHRDWFDAERWEDKSNELLQENKIDRVHLDSRALNSRPAQDETEKVAQDRKPKSPWRNSVTGKSPFLRLIGLNDPNLVDPWWTEWAVQVANWIQQGLTPWVFTHAPDDRFAPKLARLFHNKVLEKLEEHPTLPPSPLENRPSIPIQQRLFDFD